MHIWNLSCVHILHVFRKSGSWYIYALCVFRNEVLAKPWISNVLLRKQIIPYWTAYSLVHHHRSYALNLGGILCRHRSRGAPYKTQLQTWLLSLFDKWSLSHCRTSSNLEHGPIVFKVSFPRVLVCQQHLWAGSPGASPLLLPLAVARPLPQIGQKCQLLTRNRAGILTSNLGVGSSESSIVFFNVPKPNHNWYWNLSL